MEKAIGLKKIIYSIFLLLSLFLGFLFGYYFKGRKILEEKEKVVSEEVNLPSSFTSNLAEEEIGKIIDLFERLHIDRDAEKIIKMFSPPRTEKEAKDYEHIMFLDLPFSYPRLFTTAEFNYRLVSYKITRINIIKDKANAEIEEIIKEFNNVTLEWSASQSRFMILEFYKLGNNILIDRYYKKGGTIEKYGFDFTPQK